MSKDQGYGSIIPDANGAESHLLTMTLAEKVGKYVEQYVESMEKVTNDLLHCCVMTRIPLSQFFGIFMKHLLATLCRLN